MTTSSFTARGIGPRLACAVGALLAATAGHAVDDAARPAAPAVTRHYDFNATLDDKPIGKHRFTVQGDAVARKVTSDADFSVRILGIEAYHYRHHADEQWADDCLAMLAATTDDDGKPAGVKLVRDAEGDHLAITAKQKTTQKLETGCLMSYAYWNPALRAQTRLLNPQTGHVDAVRVERAGTGTITVDGKPVAATRYRIDGPEAPIDVWYSDQGEWIGLDSMVSRGEHKLSYRLQ